MESDPMSIKIEKLNTANFHTWKQRVKHVLALKDLLDLVNDDSPDTSDVSWARKDAKAQAIIGLSLSDQMLENVRESTSAKDMWNTLCNVFERHTLLNKLAARRKFYTATKEEGESALQFSNRIHQLAATLKSMNVKIDESEMAMAMLNGLPEAYDQLISALDAISGEEDNLKFDYVKSRVLQEEQRMSLRAEQAMIKSESSALVSNKYLHYLEKDRPKCEHCGKLGHTESKCWKKHPHLDLHKKETAFVVDGHESEDPAVVCLFAVDIQQ